MEISEIDQMDLVDFYRAFFENSKNRIIFSTSLEIFCKINYILGHKASLKNGGTF